MHYNVFKPIEIDFEIWASDGDNIDLPKGSIKKTYRRRINVE